MATVWKRLLDLIDPHEPKASSKGLGYRHHRLGIGILGGLPPTAHLLRKQTPLPAVGAELSVVQASGLQHHRELVGSTPAFWFLLGCRHHLSLQPPGLPPFVEGDHVDAQLF